MSWTRFLTFLGAGYAIYYAIVLFWDALHQNGPSLQGATAQVVHFSEDFEATVISDLNDSRPAVFPDESDSKAAIWGHRDEDTEEINIVPNVNVSTGGVKNIVDLYALAREKAIVVKRRIAF